MVESYNEYFKFWLYFLSSFVNTWISINNMNFKRPNSFLVSIFWIIGLMVYTKHCYDCIFKLPKDKVGRHSINFLKLLVTIDFIFFTAWRWQPQIKSLSSIRSGRCPGANLWFQGSVGFLKPTAVPQIKVPQLLRDPERRVLFLLRPPF